MFFLDNCGGLGPIVNLISKVVGIAFILIGVVLVVLIIIDLFKAVVASDEKEVKAAQKAAIRRAIYCVLMFFVTILVSVVFNLVGDTIGSEKVPNWKACWEDPLCEKEACVNE